MTFIPKKDGPPVSFCRPLYMAWRDMHARCNDPKHRNFRYYGERGIKSCRRWHSYAAFVMDMAPHPGSGWSLDRIDNNGNYTPWNCRWATHATQMQNTRRTVLTPQDVAIIRLRQKGARKLAREFGIARSQIFAIWAGTAWKEAS